MTNRIIARHGIYPDMDAEVYHNLDATSRSDLLALMRSPSYYLWRRKHPKPETDAMRMGTAIHMAILEPDKYAERYAVGPDVKLSTKAGKAEWEAFEAEHKGKALLRYKDGLQVAAIADSVRSSSAVRRLLQGEGQSELSVIWNDETTQELCRARMDRCFEGPKGPVQVDFKSTSDASPRAYRNTIARERHDLQAAFYSDGWRTAGGFKAQPMSIIVAYERPAVERDDNGGAVTAPPACSVHVIAPEAIELGRREYTEALIYLNECRESGQWPDFANVLHTYTCPSWREQWTKEERWK